MKSSRGSRILFVKGRVRMLRTRAVEDIPPQGGQSLLSRFKRYRSLAPEALFPAQEEEPILLADLCCNLLSTFSWEHPLQLEQRGGQWTQKERAVLCQAIEILSSAVSEKDDLAKQSNHKCTCGGAAEVRENPLCHDSLQETAADIGDGCKLNDDTPDQEVAGTEDEKMAREELEVQVEALKKTVEMQNHDIGICSKLKAALEKEVVEQEATIISLARSKVALEKEVDDLKKLLAGADKRLAEAVNRESSVENEMAHLKQSTMNISTHRDVMNSILCLLEDLCRFVCIYSMSSR